MTLPHCTGCTEPGSVTHQPETAEHIHDACEAEIAVHKEAERIARDKSVNMHRELTEATASRCGAAGCA